MEILSAYRAEAGSQAHKRVNAACLGWLYANVAACAPFLEQLLQAGRQIVVGADLESPDRGGPPVQALYAGWRGRIQAEEQRAGGRGAMGRGGGG